jgi:hypothetical protein
MYSAIVSDLNCLLEGITACPAPASRLLCLAPSPSRPQRQSAPHPQVAACNRGRVGRGSAGEPDGDDAIGIGIGAGSGSGIGSGRAAHRLVSTPSFATMTMSTSTSSRARPPSASHRTHLSQTSAWLSCNVAFSSSRSPLALGRLGRLRSPPTPSGSGYLSLAPQAGDFEISHIAWMTDGRIRAAHYFAGVDELRFISPLAWICASGTCLAFGTYVSIGSIRPPSWGITPARVAVHQCITNLFYFILFYLFTFL